MSEGNQPIRKSVAFEARLSGPSTIFKVSDDGDDRFIIWGKASVEVVDKEGDKITADALKNALPQLLRRKRFSVEHSDQLVGDIRESFETDEPVTVEIDGKEYTRTDFPTDVLELDDEEPALFVAGEVWDDTRQARKTREDIEDGVIDSFSISGEAISTSTKVKDGDVYDEIHELDLSAVTLCEEGMNQKAKFGTVVKIGDDPVSPSGGRASAPTISVVKSNQKMTQSDNEESETLTREDLHTQFKEATQEALKETDFVTADDVKSLVDNRMQASKEEDEEEDGPNNASDAAGDEEEEKADEVPDFPGEEDEEYDEEDLDAPDDESDDETEEKGDEAVRAAAAQVAEAYPELGLEPEDVEGAISSVVEGADGDEDVGAEGVDDLEVEADDEVPDAGAPDVEASGGGELVAAMQEKGVPDDLVEAVKEYVEGDEPEDEPPEDDEPEMPDEEEKEDESTEKDEVASEESLGEDLGKAVTDQQYLEVTASGAVPATEDDEDLMKSFERESESEMADAPGTLDLFYKSVGEEV